MIFSSKKKKAEQIQKINQKISDARQYREKMYQQSQERINSFVAQYQNDNDIASMTTTLWNSKSDSNSLKSNVDKLVKELDSFDATGYKEKSIFYLVITAMGVMWQNASTTVSIGEYVKFLDWKISPVRNSEKRTAVLIVFADKIKDLIDESHKEDELLVSSRICQLYQVNSKIGNFKTLKTWETIDEIAFIDCCKAAEATGCPTPQKPSLFTGVEITIRPQVRKKLKEL